MAVTTARDLIEKSLKEILVLGVQDTLTALELQDGLDALNLMLDSWWLEKLAVFALRRESFALTNNVATYTIGTGGAFNTTRPVRLFNAFVRYNNVDFPLVLIDNVTYDSIPYKANGGLPQVLFYDPQYPLASINLYPVPSPAGMTLFIDSYLQIRSFTSLTDAIDLPPGYARAIIKNLAVEQAPQYNKTVTKDLAAQAAVSKGAIKRNNQVQIVSTFDPAILGNYQGSSLYGMGWVI